MQSSEYKKLKKLIAILIFVVSILVLLTTASIVHSFIDPNTKSFPEVTSNPKNSGSKEIIAKVDQAQLSSVVQKQIQDQISKIPPSNGSDGSPGANGSNGKDGKSGVNGKDAQSPANGSDGQHGSNGLSAYDLWLQQGNTGTPDDFLNSLHGQNGNDGLDGKTPEFRVNPTTGQLETRMPDDRVWTVVPGSCVNLKLCGVL